MTAMNAILKFLLRGRPMTRQGFAFFDEFSGENVYYYRDQYGREWMATNRWGWFREPRLFP